jgi:hypothetical protein
LQDITDRITAQRAERQARLDAAAKADSEAQAEVLKRQQEVEDQKTEFTMDLLKAEYKAALEAKDPARIATAKAALASAQKSISEIKTPEERALEVDLTKARIKDLESQAVKNLRDDESDPLKMMQFGAELDDKALENLGIVMNTGNDWDQRITVSKFENARPNSGMVYVVEEEPNDPLGPNWLRGGASDGKFNGIKIPASIKKVIPTLTGNQVIQRAQANNMTIEEYLAILEQRLQSK